MPRFLYIGPLETKLILSRKGSDDLATVLQLYSYTVRGMAELVLGMGRH